MLAFATPGYSFLGVTIFLGSFTHMVIVSKKKCKTANYV
jgi:hypothetical protein